MRRLRDDSGLSLAELLVVVVLMGIVLGVVYMGLEFVYRSQEVAERQAHFSREISAPLRVMDQSYSQSIIPAYGTPYEPYHVRLRMPTGYVPGKILEHDYTATAGGQLIQRVYQVSGATSTLVRTVTWSTTNANYSLNVPLLTYYEGSTVTTNVVGADAVVIEICSRDDDRVYRDRRRVAFRNR